MKKPDSKDQEIERLKAELETIHKEMAEDTEESRYPFRVRASQRRIYALKIEQMTLHRLCKVVTDRIFAHDNCSCDFCVAIRKIREILQEKP